MFKSTRLCKNLSTFSDPLIGNWKDNIKTYMYLWACNAYNVALHYQNEVRIRLVLISDGSEPRLGPGSISKPRGLKRAFFMFNILTREIRCYLGLQISAGMCRMNFLKIFHLYNTAHSILSHSSVNFRKWSIT